MKLLRKVYDNTFPNEAEHTVFVYEVPKSQWGTGESRIGVHTLEPTEDEVEDALDVAFRDLFPAVFIYR